MNHAILLHGQRQRDYQKRQGIHGKVLALINRAIGFDILFPDEQDDGKLVIVEDMELGVVKHTTVYQVTELYFPTPGYQAAYSEDAYI